MPEAAIMAAPVVSEMSLMAEPAMVMEIIKVPKGEGYTERVKVAPGPQATGLPPKRSRWGNPTGTPIVAIIGRPIQIDAGIIRRVGIIRVVHRRSGLGISERRDLRGFRVGHGRGRRYASLGN